MIDIITNILGVSDDFQWISYIIVGVIFICFMDSLFNLIASIFKGVGGYK